MFRPGVLVIGMILAAVIIGLGRRYEYISLQAQDEAQEVILRVDTWGLARPCYAWLDISKKRLGQKAWKRGPKSEETYKAYTEKTRQEARQDITDMIRKGGTARGTRLCY